MSTPPLQRSIDAHPFRVLGVSARDSRQAITAQATTRALLLSEGACHAARAALTHPLARIAAELSWFPGLSPGRAEQLVQRAIESPLTVQAELGVPSLARANALTVAVESLGAHPFHSEFVGVLLALAHAVESVDVDSTVRDINEDRAVAGFPSISETDVVARELSARKRQIHDVVRSALDLLPTHILVGALTSVVSQATEGGRRHAPELIDLLVDSYEAAAQQFLQSEAKNLEMLLRAATEAAARDRPHANRLLDGIEKVVRNWDRVAQPIQLNAKARGLTHELSTSVALSIRALAVALFNEHEMTAESRRLTGLLAELFAELPQVAEKVAADAEAIESISRERVEWARSITYSSEVGLAFKDTLSISPDGVAWKGVRFPLDRITRVRWGGTKHSINGIPTGTTYVIAFGDERTEAVVDLRREEVYNAFLKCLWRAVCVRLVGELAERLRKGERISMGGAVVADEFIVLVRRRFLKGAEPVTCGWGDVVVGSSDGSFVIASSQDRKASVALPYATLSNVHILEQLLQMAFKQGCARLSDVFEDEDA